MSDLQDYPEYRAMLASVKATPADDLPRLVLADWLEEHDAPEWAEFIRSQCEVDRHPHAARIWADTFTDAEGVRRDWQDALTAARRVRELWPDVAKVIFADELHEGQKAVTQADGGCLFDLFDRPRLPLYEVRRGFVTRVVCPIGRWMGEGHHEPLGPLLVARHPVREVRLGDRVGEPERYSWYAFVDDDRIERAPRDRLPWCIADRLAGYTETRKAASQEVLGQWWFYTSPEAAHAALSHAAIAWAEAEAGL